MKTRRTTEIIIDTEEIFVMRKSKEQALRGWCETCGHEVRLILPPSADPRQLEGDTEEKG